MKFFQESYSFSSNPTLPYWTNWLSCTGKVTIAALGGEADVSSEGWEEGTGEWEPDVLRPCPHSPGSTAGAREGAWSFCNSSSSSSTLNFCAGQAGPVAISTFQPPALLPQAALCCLCLQQTCPQLLQACGRITDLLLQLLSEEEKSN